MSEGKCLEPQVFASADCPSRLLPRAACYTGKMLAQRTSSRTLCVCAAVGSALAGVLFAFNGARTGDTSNAAIAETAAFGLVCTSTGLLYAWRPDQVLAHLKRTRWPPFGRWWMERQVWWWARVGTLLGAAGLAVTALALLERFVLPAK